MKINYLKYLTQKIEILFETVISALNWQQMLISFSYSEGSQQLFLIHGATIHLGP